MKLYRIHFNHFGADYVVANSFDEAEEKLRKEYSFPTIKSIDVVAEEGSSRTKLIK